ncbi:MAG TPA: DUF1003 domain-containing protein [Vicinamibacterales bacterium]|nr:DUF1003 domain-containing protein [Vicinamibacterales bacterium]
MMQLIVWTATGLGVGWLVRTAMRSRRDFGLVGDLTTGWLGGVVGGWLFRQLGVIAPDHPAAHVVVALVGASALLIGIRVLRHATFAARDATPARARAPLADFEELIRGVSQLERRIISGLLTKTPSVVDPNQSFEAQSTFGERVADRVAKFGGSWTFIGLFFIGMISWMAMNQEMGRAFDPYPFILLNLVLSCLAALQAPVIMMSQNRQSAKDRSDAKNDYEVNVRAEVQISALHTKLDLLREQEIVRLTHLVEAQQRVLDAMHARLAAPEGGSHPPAGG